MIAEPGFTQSAFEALKAAADSSRKKHKKLLCSCIMDEMSIKKHIEWDGQKFRGFVD